MNNFLLNSCYLGWIITPQLQKDFEFSNSSIFKRKKSEVTKTSPQSELEPGPLAQETSDYPPELSASWWMQLEKDRSNQFGRNGPLYKHCSCKRSQARTSTRSVRFALFKYNYNIHLAFVNIGWYLARDMALGAHGWPRRYLPRLRRSANM